VLAEHAEQEIRSKLNAFSRKLWTMQSVYDHQELFQDNVYDSLMEIFDEDAEMGHNDDYWRAVVAYLKQQFR